MLQIGKKIKKIPFFDMIPWIWMAVGFLYDMWYQIYPGKWVLDSDLASEMVLSDLLNSTGEIISKNWYYSSEVRVFQSQWFYRIGLLIFPNNWHYARVFASALLLLVFLTAILFMAHLIGMGKYGAWFGAILMWPFSSWYLVYGLYGTYYIIYMLFSVLTVSVLVLLSKSHGFKTILLYILGLFLAFASGLNGIKQTMIFFAPLLVASFFVLLLAIRKNKPHVRKELFETCKSEIRMLGNTIVFVICNVAGYLANSRILSKYYSFADYGEMIWTWDFQRSFTDVWLDFFLLFGHQRNVLVLSFCGIVSFLGILFGAVIVFSMIRLCFHHDRLSSEQKLILLLVISTLVVCGCVFTLMEVDYKLYYWLPLFPFAIAILLIEIQTEDFSMNNAREALLIGLGVCVTLCSVGTVKKEIEAPLFGRKGINQVADWLVENGYTQGYAIFWNSNVLREMSNGKIETWTIYSGENDFIYQWLQEVEHTTTKPEEPYFLFINSEIGGGPECYQMLQNGEGVLVYEDAPFYVYSFDSSLEN